MERPDQVIYENSRGVLTVLDGVQAPWRELMGRMGIGTPALRYSETTYANGVTETNSVSMASRDVALFFWMDGYDEAERKARYHALKLALLETGKKNSWGRLHFRCSDGRWVFLNCIYAGGLDQDTESDACFKRFSLDFHSSDPLFYERDPHTIPMNTAAGKGLRMAFRMGANVMMRSSRSAVYQVLIRMNAFSAWPDIELTGPAKGIRFDNSAGDKSIYFQNDFELLADEKLMISTRPLYHYARKRDAGGVTQDVSNRLSPGATLRWPLVNGDNLITLRMTGMSADTQCVFQYREGHLSLW